MDTPDNFMDELNTKLQQYAQECEKTYLTALKADFRSFSSIFASFMNILKKTGLIADDPYQYEEKISDVKPVSQDNFLEGQKQTVMSIRLHNFENQLQFLNDFYQFSLDFMHLARMKNLSQFTRFIRWENFSETNADINTKALAEITGRIRKGDDSISIGLLNDMLNQLSTYQNKILEGLKKISFYKREEYKNMIRTTFWEALNLSSEEVNGNLDNVHRKIKKEFAAHIKGQPYIPELIKELLDEDFGASSYTLKQELLSKLSVTQAVKEKPKQKVDYRANLMEAIRTLCSMNIPLEAALKKLRENTLVLEDTQLSMGERFQRWMRKLMGIKARPKFYTVELFDPVTSATRNEELDFEKFHDELYGRIRVMVNLANRTSAQFLAMTQKPEKEILDFFDRTFLDISKALDRLAGLDLFFKTETPKEKRTQIKGIKAEVSQVRTILANANKLKHEYVGTREEQEQLRRLGVKVD